MLVAADAELDLPAPRAAVLLSPFDNLLWDRPFARRILGFDHLIEVYKPAPQRRYGYYVLPFLRGDRIVGRADLKSERNDGRLVVRAFHREDGVRASARPRRRARPRARPARPHDRARRGAALKVSVEEARRIAVRAQVLDGSATGVLETVRRLGFLQIDVVAPVERPQHLVLFSRLGPATTAPSSTGCSGRSARSSSGTRSSTRSRTCRSSARGSGTSAARGKHEEPALGAPSSWRRTAPSSATSCASSSGTGRSSRATSRTARRARRENTAGGARARSG